MLDTGCGNPWGETLRVMASRQGDGPYLPLGKPLLQECAAQDDEARLNTTGMGCVSLISAVTVRRSASRSRSTVFFRLDPRPRVYRVQPPGQRRTEAPYPLEGGAEDVGDPLLAPDPA
jgi:hypothetical protein